MLKKLGKGTTLDDLNKVKGGIVGACGTNCCEACGVNNEQRLDTAFSVWERTDTDN